MADEVIRIEDIVDRDGLESWLTNWPVSQGLDETAARQVAVTIAHRAAMRVMPVMWQFSLTENVRDRNLTVLPILRSLLTSGVAAESPTPEIHAAADSATLALSARYALAARYASASASANYASADYASADYAAASAADYAAAEYASEDAAWDSIRADCTEISAAIDVFSSPLWSDRELSFSYDWSIIKSQVSAPEWAFWINWYDAALTGNTSNWDTLGQIALIENEVWDAGPVVVAAEIDKIELKFSIQATPNAEDIIVNDEGLYQAIPRSTLPARTLQDSKDRIGDVIAQIQNAQQSSNQYSALVPEAELLERVLVRYGDNALRLHEVCRKVVRHTVVYVADGVLPENDNLVGDVSDDLINSADDIYNFDVDVKKTVDARAKLRFERLTEDEKSNFVALVDAVAERSVEPFAQELREDARIVAEDVEPTEDTNASRYQLGSRLVRIVAIGGGGLVVATTALSQAEGAVKGGVYLWQIIRPLLGF